MRVKLIEEPDSCAEALEKEINEFCGCHNVVNMSMVHARNDEYIYAYIMYKK